jgi:predicted amidophosphoribosyltransferase
VGTTFTTLLDLVLPAACAGCGASARTGICPTCTADLAQEPTQRRPRPSPPGLPVCLSGGDYDGTRRSLILAYKERNQHSLAGPLGDALGAVIRVGWPGPGPVVVVPVPGTAASVRARHGDHMLRLARRAAAGLCGVGCPAAVAVALRALPKADSAHLDRVQRAIAAGEAFAVRRRWRDGPRTAALRALADEGAVVLVDDVLTTGSTLAAASGKLLEIGVPVTFAATLAATRLRR